MLRIRIILSLLVTILFISLFMKLSHWVDVWEFTHFKISNKSVCLLFLNVVQQFINNSFLPCLFPLLFKVAVVSTYPIISAQYSSVNYSWLNNNFILTFARFFRSNYLSVSTRHIRKYKYRNKNDYLAASYNFSLVRMSLVKFVSAWYL